MSHRVCLLQPGPCSPSETAIGNHTRLLPARVHVIAGPRRSRPRGGRNWRWPTPGVRPSPRRRGSLGHDPLRHIEGAWAEDGATRGRDPSTDPGAKTGEGGTMPPHGLPGLAQKSINLFTVLVPSD